jgi:uncharacterized protein with HEPN domain
MALDLSTYLCDIVEACNAVEDVIKGVTLKDYRIKRAIRPSVERESVVDFRNLLTHNYSAINDNAVYVPIYSDLIIFLILYTLRPGNRERSCLRLRLALRLKKETAAGCVLTHHRTGAGHPPQLQVDGGGVVVQSRRRELNGSQDQGQKHGHQRSIQVPYQWPAGVREQRPPAVAKGAR